MKLLLLLAAFPALVIFSGCETTHTAGAAGASYYKITETNYSGDRIIGWISEGKPRPHEGGYRFNAVERTVYRPVVMNYRYPLGRSMWASATNMIICPVEKPLWMAYITPETYCAGGVVTTREFK